LRRLPEERWCSRRRMFKEVFEDAKGARERCLKRA
jgi:hypothetical protein